MAKQKGGPFAVFDIDGTLVRWQLYHAIADSLVKLGYIESSDFESIKEARMVWKHREHSESFKEYERKLVVIYEKIMKKLTLSQFNEAAQAVFEEYKDQVYTYTRELIYQLRKDRYLLFAISGSQTEIVAKIAKYYGFDEFIGSTYVHKDNRFTGEVELPFRNKDLALKQMIEKHKANMEGSIAVGDSLSDVKMLEMVEVPIAFNPEKKLFDFAKSKKWRIVIERKNMVYELRPEDGQYQLVQTKSR